MALYKLEKKGFESLDELGSGAFGTVRKYKPSDREECVALKWFEERSETFNREIEMIGYDHLNLVKCYGYFSIEKSGKGIVMELCHTDLEKLLTNQNLTLDEVVEILSQIANGLKYLHRKKTFHRDLKPPNILIKASPEVEYKIGDFGLSCIVEEMLTQNRSVVGSEEFMAPELLDKTKWEQKPNNSNEHVTPYNYKVDIYSFGKIGLYLIKNLNYGQEESACEEIKSFLARCCDEEPSERPYAMYVALFFKYIKEFPNLQGNDLFAKIDEKINVASKINEFNLKLNDNNTCSNNHLEAKRNILYSFKNIGMFDEAREVAEEVLDKTKQLREEDHWDIIISAKRDLSVIFHELKMFESARKLDEEVLTTTRRYLGEDNIRTCRAKLFLAETLEALKKFDEARKLKEEVQERLLRKF